jgi:hypothetical protein
VEARDERLLQEKTNELVKLIEGGS